MSYPYEIRPTPLRAQYRKDRNLGGVMVDESGVPVGGEAFWDEVNSGRGDFVNRDGQVEPLPNPLPSTPEPRPSEPRVGLAGKGPGLPSLENIASLVAKAREMRSGGPAGVAGVPGRMVQQAATGGGGGVAGSAPMDDEAGLRAGVHDAETASDDLRLGSGLGEAGGRIGAAIAGSRFDPEPYRNQARQAEVPVERARSTLDEFRAVQAAKARGEDARQALEFRRQELALKERGVQAQEKRAERPSGGMSSSLAYRMGRDQLEDERRRQERADKLEQENAERRISGLEPVASNIRPSADAAKKAKDTKSTIAAMMPDIDFMLEQLTSPSGSGTEMGGGGDQARLERARQAVSDRLRIFSEMGVPNARDYESLAAMLPELTGLGAMTTRNSTLAAKLQSLKEALLRTETSTYEALGYRSSQQRAPQGGDVSRDGDADSAAVAWAKANPNDPRAAQILELNGVQ